MIFRTRTRMLDIKHNFRGKYNDTKCRRCNEPNETQEHILEICTGIHEGNNNRITKAELFEKDPIQLKTTATKIRNIMKILGE